MPAKLRPAVNALASFVEKNKLGLCLQRTSVMPAIYSAHFPKAELVGIENADSICFRATGSCPDEAREKLAAAIEGRLLRVRRAIDEPIKYLKVPKLL